jgi:hypothetical protein
MSSYRRFIDYFFVCGLPRICEPYSLTNDGLCVLFDECADDLLNIDPKSITSIFQQALKAETLQRYPQKNWDDAGLPPHVWLVRVFTSRVSLLKRRRARVCVLVLFSSWYTVEERIGISNIQYIWLD